ncbi:hypothetical protein TSOC_011242 [Tetrabaena socialis]|uniref:Uncharacterized protein n=1 Tax=Tetrabaena socialis TaxID=47790 RepID=A0A2J7ZR58_9CHLO|nr:hypothetical protein TSOC_011242 [Tetrabaena socialis]|eukprot:PNH02748.1 hypothetical protein TSOC_011242 [Tetrabaena socialis]
MHYKHTPMGGGLSPSRSYHTAQPRRQAPGGVGVAARVKYGVGVETTCARGSIPGTSVLSAAPAAPPSLASCIRVAADSVRLPPPPGEAWKARAVKAEV